jgi:hypothetical protein
MRASEFLVEKHQGHISKRQQQSTVGLHRFRDSGGYDRAYELNRVMMAVACADGTDTPIDMDAASWVGKYNTASPYSKEEQKMLKQAFKAVGSESHDLNHGDLESRELESTNKQSPIKGFAGYPR